MNHLSLENLKEFGVNWESIFTLEDRETSKNEIKNKRKIFHFMRFLQHDSKNVKDQTRNFKNFTQTSDLMRQVRSLKTF